MNTEKTEIAVFGGGCFWCTEAVFKMLKGVLSVSPGFSGGTVKNSTSGGEKDTEESSTNVPTYQEVSSGNTGHAECIRIEFDREEISYKDLLTVFFGSHDPTTLNKQGNDFGTQYRSVIFYTTDIQKKIAEDFILELNNSSKEGRPIVTEVVPLLIFYTAENYHENYYERNKDAPYCQLVINPKLEKVVQEFGELLKNSK